MTAAQRSAALDLVGAQIPAVSTALLTRLAGIGTLRDVDALLLLTRHDPADRTSGPAGNGLVTETLYTGTDLDDANVWARAVKLRAAEVLFAPGDDGSGRDGPDLRDGVSPLRRLA